MTITADQLRIAPSVEVMRELATTHPKGCRISNNLTISFVTRGFGRHDYDLRFLPGVMAGSKVEVVVNPFRMPAINVAYTDESTGERCWIVVEPIARDESGWREDAPVIGQELRSAPRSQVDHNRDEVMVAAFGGANAEEAALRQEKNALVFDGRVDPFRRFVEAELPAYLPRRGTALETERRVVEASKLSVAEAAKRLKDALGEHYSPDVYKWLQTKFQDGVPEDQLDGLAKQFGPTRTSPVEAPAATPALRIVGGAS